LKRKEWARDIALQRIEMLFELAEREQNDERRNRYVQLARRIGMRNRVRIPGHLKMRMCKSCHSFLIPGRNARVRLRGDRLVTTCLQCSYVERRPYKK
jgi:ribonuclease P protein subunit RPR2